MRRIVGLAVEYRVCYRELSPGFPVPLTVILVAMVRSVAYFFVAHPSRPSGVALASAVHSPLPVKELL